MVSEVASVEIVHDEVEVLPILKGVDHVDQEGVTKFCQKLPLVEDRSYRFFANNFGFAHEFHGIDLLVSFVLDLPDFSKTSLSNCHDSAEVKFGYLGVIGLLIVVHIHHEGLSPLGAPLLADNVVIFNFSLSLRQVVSLVVKVLLVGLRNVNFEGKIVAT